MKKPAIIPLLFIVAAARLFSFSAEGHKTVAAIATNNISERTHRAVATILENQTLMEASVWPDEIKPPFGALAKTAEAKAFNRTHTDNRTWHYVNFPVGSKRYSSSSPYAYQHDIVATINGCIAVLEGGSHADLTAKEALRWLVHLVGDIHQPLHVVAGYYDLSDPNSPKREINLLEIDRDTNDGGGGALD